MKTEQKQGKGMLQRLEEAIFSIPEKKTAYENLMVGLKTVGDIHKSLKEDSVGRGIVSYWETAEDGDKYLHEVTYWADGDEVTHKLIHEDVIKLIYNTGYWGIFSDKYYLNGSGFFPSCYLKQDGSNNNNLVPYEDDFMSLEDLNKTFTELMAKYGA